MCEASELGDLDMLDKIRNELYNKLIKEIENPKVGELLRVIEMKQKISVEGKGEKKFWEMVNKIRTEELTKAKSKRSRKGKSSK